MKMNNPHNQAWHNKIRRQFLLTFFDGNHYGENKVNGFFLIKQFNQKLMDWEVAIYTEEAYRKRKANQERVSKLLEPRRNEQKRG